MRIWTVSGFRDERAAAALADELSASSSRVRGFDDALAAWLTGYGEVMSSRPRLGEGPPGRDTDVDRRLGQEIDALAGPAERTYAWARLLKAHDGLWKFAFGWSVTGPLLRFHLEQVSPPDRDPKHVLSVIEYLSVDMADSPTSGATAELWRAADQSGLLAADTERERALVALLSVVRRREFHHDLRDIERVLRSFQAGDERLRAELTTFRPENRQGSAMVAGWLLRENRLDSAVTAGAVADTLAWLVDAKAKQPAKRWYERLAALRASGFGPALDAVCAEVERHPEYARHERTGWRDELFWFMWKSSAWYAGREPQRILS